MHTNSSEKNEDKQLFIKKQVKKLFALLPLPPQCIFRVQRIDQTE